MRDPCGHGEHDPVDAERPLVAGLHEVATRAARDLPHGHRGAHRDRRVGREGVDQHRQPTPERGERRWPTLAPGAVGEQQRPVLHRLGGELRCRGVQAQVVDRTCVQRAQHRVDEAVADLATEACGQIGADPDVRRHRGAWEQRLERCTGEADRREDTSPHHRPEACRSAGADAREAGAVHVVSRATPTRAVRPTAGRSGQARLRVVPPAGCRGAAPLRPHRPVARRSPPCAPARRVALRLRAPSRPRLHEQACAPRRAR